MNSITLDFLVNNSLLWFWGHQWLDDQWQMFSKRCLSWVNLLPPGRHVVFLASEITKGSSICRVWGIPCHKGHSPSRITPALHPIFVSSRTKYWSLRIILHSEYITENPSTFLLHSLYSFTFAFLQSYFNNHEFMNYLIILNRLCQYKHHTFKK
jgi:hypothetical protein